MKKTEKLDVTQVMEHSIMTTELNAILNAISIGFILIMMTSHY